MACSVSSKGQRHIHYPMKGGEISNALQEEETEDKIRLVCNVYEEDLYKRKKWPEGTSSYNKLFLSQNPALVAENQISLYFWSSERKVIVALVSCF